MSEGFHNLTTSKQKSEVQLDHWCIWPRPLDPTGALCKKARAVCRCSICVTFVAFKRVPKYLSGTMDLDLIFRRESKTLQTMGLSSQSMADSDASGCISWMRYKKMITASSCKAELNALFQDTKAGIDLQRLCTEMSAPLNTSRLCFLWRSCNTTKALSRSRRILIRISYRSVWIWGTDVWKTKKIAWAQINGTRLRICTAWLWFHDVLYRILRSLKVWLLSDDATIQTHWCLSSWSLPLVALMILKFRPQESSWEWRLHSAVMASLTLRSCFQGFVHCVSIIWVVFSMISNASLIVSFHSLFVYKRLIHND